MFQIDQSRIANVDTNLAALLLMAGVFVLTLRQKKTGSKADTAFLFIMIGALIMSACGLLVEFVEGSGHPGARVMALLLETLLEMGINLVLLAWMLYVFYTMYDSDDYLKRRIGFYLTPAVIMTVAEIINVFTGFLWYYDENVEYQETVLYDVFDLLRYFYLILIIYTYQNYKKQEGHIRFFSIWPVVIPILWGTLIELVIHVSGFTLGACIGMSMFFIMASEKESFTDEESGFYNLHYLKWLSEKISEGTYDPHLIIRYRLPQSGDMTEFFAQLHQVLPDQCDTIKMDDMNYITVIYGNTRGLVNILSEDIAMIADELHMDIQYTCAVKEKKETPLAFFRKNAVIGG